MAISAVRSVLARPIFFASALILAACGGGGGGGGSGAGGGGGAGDDGANTVEGVLDRLEVDTDASQRLGANEEPLPDTYAPFGSRVTANKFSEVLLFGVPIDDPGLSESRHQMAITNLVPRANNRYSWELLHDEPAANTPWTDPSATRASAVGDFDGDGVDEIAMVYQLDGDVKLRLVDDAAADYQLGSPSVVDNESVAELFLAAGDLDGDSDVDLLLGLVDNAGSAEIKLLENQDGDFRYTGLRLQFPRGVSRITQLVLRTGNLDQDAALELAVAVNTSGSDASYSVFDDAARQMSSLVQEARLELPTSSGSVRAAVLNLDLGDVDGDGIDELLLAGLNKTGRVRSGDPYSSFEYLIELRDDALVREGQRLAVLASGFDDILTADDGNYQPSSSGAQQELAYVPVVLADVDGDGAKEALVGQHLYHSQLDAPAALRYYDDGNSRTDDDGRARIPMIEWFGEARSGMSFDFNWRTHSLAAGDVTQDGRENIVMYSQRFATTIGDNQTLQVWGHDQIEGWVKMQSYANGRSASNVTAYTPQLHLPDIELDDGTATLTYAAGSHRLVFTEPLVIAAIAAPPCATDLGQDLDECRSAFGRRVESSSSTTNGASLTARASVGVRAYGEGSVGIGTVSAGVEVTASLEGTIRRWRSESYTLTKSLAYVTGPIEDSVLFSSVPMDIYAYKVLSHPDPNLVGSTVEVRLPREPITTLVSRQKYNGAVLDESLKIDSDIFEHVAGDPSSYPSRAEKNSLLNRYSGLEGPRVTVGEGGGYEVSGISEFRETATGVDYSAYAEVEVRVTAGVEVGGSVGPTAGLEGSVALAMGVGVDAAFESRHGTGTDYEGAVANIDSASFDAGRGYDWGMFTYVVDRAGVQPFEVLNYWVD